RCLYGFLVVFKRFPMRRIFFRIFAMPRQISHDDMEIRATPMIDLPSISQMMFICTMNEDDYSFCRSDGFPFPHFKPPLSLAQAATPFDLYAYFDRISIILSFLLEVFHDLPIQRQTSIHSPLSFYR